MRIVLRLPRGLYEELCHHLLPARVPLEQAAFLFAKWASERGVVWLDVVETARLSADDLAAQHSDYLELSDTCRIGLIKRAHQLGASLVEMHSHIGRWPAAFSEADRAGLLETVPHMRWRLPQRPYVAVVVAATGFDALAWVDDARIPSSSRRDLRGRPTA